jgi:uncharacterized protein DUF4328
MNYRSARTRSRVVIGLLIAIAVLDGLSFVSAISQLWLLSHAAAGQPPSHTAAVANDLRQMLVGLFQGLMVVPIAVAFCFWIHRASANLEGLGYVDQDYSPGWAVGWFFVPFLNLVRPYQVMREIWNASRPILDDGTVLATTEIMRMNETPVPVVGWWGVYLLYGLAGQLHASFTMGAKTLSDLITTTYMQMVVDVIALLSALLAIHVVRTVTRMQEERFALIAAAQAPPTAESVASGAPPESPGLV